MKVIQFLE